MDDSTRDLKETLLNYARTDVLCFRTLEVPELKARQEELFAPLLDWVKEEAGLELAVTETLTPPPLPEESERALSSYLEGLPLRERQDLFFLARLYGSVALGLAALKKRLTVEEAFVLSLTEEFWQNERWGADAEALARRAQMLKEAHEFLRRPS